MGTLAEPVSLVRLNTRSVVSRRTRQVRQGALRSDIVCRSCEKPIHDVDFRCEQCSDWDLCKACVWLLPIRTTHNPNHLFVLYEYSQDRNAFQAAPLQSALLARSRPSIALSGTDIKISWEYIPWESDLSGVNIPKLAGKRIKLNWDSTERNRATIWGLAQVASSGVLSEDDLFRFSGTGACYTLTPPWRSLIPLQWVHVGPGAIPNSLADILCEFLSTKNLLFHLNATLGTSHTLDMPGLQPCLEHALHVSRDFGALYGALRLWWSDDFTRTLEKIKARQDKVQRRWADAIQGSCIQDCEIPPRRVWDLRSNRVLPFYVLPPPEDDYFDVPENLWTLSHSWVDERERAGVWTTINGRQWPVPVPCQTTLDHVRIELLNMGAEYVWLDVLCLRQEGGVDEKLRLEEWKLDVPTIGRIFHAIPNFRPCITYFNGLGLPLDTSITTCQSIRHWSKRVWTVQESLDTWLPGGLTADLGVDSSALFTELHGLLSGMSSWSKQGTGIFQAIQMRHCTTELDRIAGLAYNLGCKTLPLYDRTISVESAWTLLIKHMDRRQRTNCFLQYASDTPFGLWMSAQGLLTSQPALPTALTEQGEDMRLVDELELYTNAPGQYHHAGYALGACHIKRSACDHEDCAAGLFHLQFADTPKPVTVHATAEHGIFLRTVTYTLLGIGSFGGMQHWVVIEVVGEREVQGGTALEAVKWGVVYVGEQEALRLRGLDFRQRHDTRVVYLSSEEALTRSKHVDEYLKAFGEARARGGKAESRKAS